MANDFQMVKQTQLEWCWAAVGAAVNGYLEPTSNMKSDCQIATLIFNENCCVPVLPANTDTQQSLSQVFNSLNMNGFSVETQVNTVMSFSDIQTQINAGLPVCARITWFGEFGAHFVVIYGWGISASGDQWVDVGDPLFPNSTILYNSFVSNYQDAGQWNDTYVVKKV